MARYDVSTWDEFVTAWQTVDGNDIIEVNADLDANDNIPTANIEMRHWSVAGPVTVNGNGHTIYNVSGGGSCVFTNNNHSVIINKLNFQNMNLTNPLFRGFNYERQMTINDCNIQGRSSGFFFIRYINFFRCTFTLTNTNSQIFGNNDDVFLNYCWIYLRRCKKTWNGTNQPLLRHANTCYIKGEIDMTDITNTDIVTGVNNCCVNVTVTGVTATGLPLDRYVHDGSGQLTIVNKSKLPEDTTASTANLITGVTDYQMKNAVYLSSIGFDIVPTSE